jgi:putative heme degradation protein
MTLVRNDHLVAMPVGSFDEVTIDGTKGRAHGGTVDIHFDFSRFGSVFALTDESKGAIRRSLYFFDDCGAAALKALLWSKEGDDAFEALVERFREPAPGDVVTAPKSKEDWRSAKEFASGRSVEDKAQDRAIALIQAVIDHEINVDWRIPARATEERYSGPLRNLRKREDSEGWYDVNYPHFNTHLAVCNIARLASVNDPKSGAPAVALIDGADMLICRIALAADNSPKAKDAWAAAVLDAVR